MNCPYTLKFLYIKLGVNLNWFCTGIGPPYLYDKPVNVASQSGKIGKQEEHYNVRFKHEETQYTDKLLEVLRGKDEDVKAMVKSTIDIAAQKEYKRLCLLDYNEWVAERCPERRPERRREERTPPGKTDKRKEPHQYRKTA